VTPLKVWKVRYLYWYRTDKPDRFGWGEREASGVLYSYFWHPPKWPFVGSPRSVERALQAMGVQGFHYLDLLEACEDGFPEAIEAERELVRWVRSHLHEEAFPVEVVEVDESQAPPGLVGCPAPENGVLRVWRVSPPDPAEADRIVSKIRRVLDQIHERHA
jgi:hypothetical protein